MTSTAATLAALSFFAAGANALAAAVLLLFIPWHRQVRWYVAFTLAQVAWLLVLGAEIASGAGDVQWGGALGAISLLLPATFLAVGLVADHDAPPRTLALVFLAYLALLPATMSETPWLSRLANIVGHGAGWGVASWLLWRSRRSSKQAPRSAREQQSSDWLHRATLALPIFVVVAITLGLHDAFAWIIPPGLVIVQLLIFYGLLRHEFYHVEVRIARSGELAAAAAERERLAVLGELSATVAHEVRNPLTGMRSLAQRLVHDDVDDAKRRRYAEVIVGEIDRVERIVGDLLALARKSPVPQAAAERVQLNALFEDLALLASPRGERSGVTIHIDSGALAVHAPREALTQVLLNLVFNAIAASPATGAVRVSAEETTSGTVISVSDQGSGVAPDMRDRIFEAFHTGSGGAGLGLALVRRVSDAEGWSVRVTDAPGGGARFEIVLPKAAVIVAAGAA